MPESPEIVASRTGRRRADDAASGDPASGDGHVLPDLLRPGLTLVFCGSAAGNESARRSAYYAHPQNRFWATLHRCGFTPSRLDPHDYARLLDHGIGLTDLAKTESGSDDQLSRHAYDPAALRAKIARGRPGMLAFTSKTPARAFLRRARLDYGLQPDRIGETRIFVLPSPSPRNQARWDEARWHDLARLTGFDGARA
jgi:TDG/mug DNA glycosylase family protein